MNNMKSTIVIIVFGMLCLLITLLSLSEDSNLLNESKITDIDIIEETDFIDVSYYKLDSGVPAVELNSKQLTIRDENLLKFLNPSGLLINDGREIKYRANQGEMNQLDSSLELIGEVTLSELSSSYQSDNINYDGEKDEITAIGNVETNIVDSETGDKIKLNSEKLESQLKTKILTLAGSVKGTIQRKRRYEGKMTFSADNVEINSPSSVVKLSNNVKLRRNSYYLTAGNAEIFLENYNKKLKYYTLYDDVKLEEKLNTNSSGKPPIRRAYAEKLVAHQKTGKLVLTGAPRVEQGSDVIKGYQITLRESVEMVEVDDSKSSFNFKRKKQ